MDNKPDQYNMITQLHLETHIQMIFRKIGTLIFVYAILLQNSHQVKQNLLEMLAFVLYPEPYTRSRHKLT